MTRLALVLLMVAAIDPRQAMITGLGSDAPNPSLGAEAQTFDRLVGTWDTDFSFHRPDGTVSHKRGEVRFGWILDGRAIQDIWITEPANGEKERRIGTSLRYFDTSLKQWRVVFMNPQFNYLVTVQGGTVGDRIVLTGNDKDGLPIRWIFSDIKPDSFVWRGETSHDGGKTFRLEEEHRMTRRTSDPSAVAATFKQLTSVAGEWEGMESGVPIKVSYTVTANGSALMETMRPGNESPMITMFTVDGDRMIATHYCSVGNQPQMISSSIGDLSKDGVTFTLAKVTGMKTADDWHNTGLTVTLADADHMTQRWTYAYKGQSGTNTFHYVRRHSAR